MIRVLARPLSALLTFCFVFHCDGFFAMANPWCASRDLRAHVDGTTYHFRHQSVAVALARFSGTASNRPIGGVFHSRSSLYWDFDGRMVAATTPTESLTFSYDVDGIRWRKTVSGVSTQFVVDKNRDFAQVLEERDAAGAVQRLHVWGDDHISQQGPEGDHFFHVDGQLSTRQLTDGGANVTDTYTFDAFGLTLAQSGTTSVDYLYAGQQLDTTAGLYYLRARFYDPPIGRLTSRDPKNAYSREPASLHRYLYAGANPVNLHDPSGLGFLGFLKERLITVIIVAILLAVSIPATIYALKVGRQTSIMNVLSTARFLKSNELALLRDAKAELAAMGQYPDAFFFVTDTLVAEGGVTFTKSDLAYAGIESFESRQIEGEVPVIGRDLIVLHRDTFDNKHRLAITLFAEGQHLDDSGDSQSLQDALDEFIDRYLASHPDLSESDRRSILQVPPHFGTTKRPR